MGGDQKADELAFFAAMVVVPALLIFCAFAVFLDLKFLAFLTGAGAVAGLTSAFADAPFVKSAGALAATLALVATFIVVIKEWS